MKLHSLALVAAIPIVCGSLLVIATGDAEEAWATTIDLQIASDVLELASESDVDFEVPDRWVTLAYVGAQLPRSFRSRLPVRDGWRNEFLVTRRDGVAVVASAGPDGVLDVEADDRLEQALQSAFRRTRGPVPFDDLVMIVGARDIVNAPLTTAARKRATMGDLRSIGMAIESYSIDNDRYPLQDDDYAGLLAIATTLAPIYLRTLPRQDAWGHEILYWSNAREYVILAPGADGLVEPELAVGGPGLVGRGATVGADADIVFANGQFVQWPDGVQP